MEDMMKRIRALEFKMQEAVEIVQTTTIDIRRTIFTEQAEKLGRAFKTEYDLDNVKQNMLLYGPILEWCQFPDDFLWDYIEDVLKMNKFTHDDATVDRIYTLMDWDYDYQDIREVVRKYEPRPDIDDCWCYEQRVRSNLEFSDIKAKISF